MRRSRRGSFVVHSARGANAFRFATRLRSLRGDALGSGAIAVSGRIGSQTRTFAGIAAATLTACRTST